MKTVGFAISGKENEGRRAILPRDLQRVKNTHHLQFEQGYATHLGIADREYEAFGCAIKSKREIYRCDVVCNPKTPQADERQLFQSSQVLFGWLHAVQGRTITDFLQERGMTGIAWEDMFEDGRHCFWRNNEIAGEAAVLHALRYLGKLPAGLEVAILGRGNCARGAYKAFTQLGARITNYDRATEGLLRKEIGRFDVIVNAVLWDVFRTDHILYNEDLKRMRWGAMLIDISCDEHMGIESSEPTTIADPVYVRDGIIHYVVDHTPALFHRTTTEAISEVVAGYVDELVEDRLGACLQRATVIAGGVIRDERIIKFQKRSSMPSMPR
jgi:N5-(carboxyethyl)ornithine synthase